MSVVEKCSLAAAGSKRALFHNTHYIALPENIRLRTSQAYAILTMCRMLYTFKHGEFVSKKKAALWAEKELPECTSLIQRAVLWRDAWRDEHMIDDPRSSGTRLFVYFSVSKAES